MANIPYQGGVATVQPTIDRPNDYQRVDTSPADFGGLVAQGEQKLGQGAEVANKFFQGVQTDDVTNQWMKDSLGVVEGYKKLSGQDALNAQASTSQQLDDISKKYKGLLQTPAQQYQFDQTTRTYNYRFLTPQISSHADQAYKDYSSGVIDDGYKTTLGTVATAFSSNALYSGDVNSNINTYIQDGLHDSIGWGSKAAQLKGVESDPNQVNALTQGYQAGVYKTAVETLLSDPQGRGAAYAQKLLNDPATKKALGESYYQLYDSVQERINQQISAGAASDAYGNASTPLTSPSSPVIQQAVATAPGGFSAQGAAKMIGVESGGRNVTNQFGFTGPAQVGTAVWKEYGQGDIHSPLDNIIAAQRNAAANARIMTPDLGRRPTDNELYLAHQQGAGGALKLLADPHARAGDLVGDAAIKNNGGDPNAPAIDFVNLTYARFNKAPSNVLPTFAAMQGTQPTGTPWIAPPPVLEPESQVPAAPNVAPLAAPTLPSAPSAPAAPVLSGPEAKKVQAYQTIASDPKLSPIQRQMAYDNINRQAAAEAVGIAADAKAKSDANDKAANGYMSQVLSSTATPQTMQQIANDPSLDYKTKDYLANAIMSHATVSASGAAASYGPGFWQAFKGVTAQPGTDGYIGDVGSLLQRAGPGGDLTLAGVDQLNKYRQMAQKSVDGNTQATVLSGILRAGHALMSFQDPDDQFSAKDPRGEMVFNTQFTSAVAGQLQTWVAAGNPVDKFPLINPDNLREFVNRLRPQQQKLMDQVNQTNPAAQDAWAKDPIPAAPIGVNAGVWNNLLGQPIPKPDGSGLWSRQTIGAALSMLASDPANISLFNASPFGQSGLSGAALYTALKGFEGTPAKQVLGPAATAPTASAPSVAASIATPAPTMAEAPVGAGLEAAHEKLMAKITADRIKTLQDEDATLDALGEGVDIRARNISRDRIQAEITTLRAQQAGVEAHTLPTVAPVGAGLEAAHEKLIAKATADRIKTLQDEDAALDKEPNVRTRELRRAQIQAELSTLRKSNP
jgi:hypothetical protein